jgi:V8-like Glu-specific endopeptidase
MNPMTTVSLRLEAVGGGAGPTAEATGFLVERESRWVLVTNRHVVNDGRLPNEAAMWEEERGESRGKGKFTPEELVAYFPGPNNDPMVVKLKLRGDTLRQPWTEHPRWKEKIDVVALPVKPPRGHVATPLSIPSAGLSDLPVATRVSIVGFPAGKVAGAQWPIWKVGHLAAQPDHQYEDYRAYMVDISTKPGMSGAPAVVESAGACGEMAYRFLGVYSGQITDHEIGKRWSHRLDIGLVWRAEVVWEVVAAAFARESQEAVGS